MDTNTHRVAQLNNAVVINMDVDSNIPLSPSNARIHSPRSPSGKSLSSGEVLALSRSLRRVPNSPLSDGELVESDSSDDEHLVDKVKGALRTPMAKIIQRLDLVAGRAEAGGPIASGSRSYSREAEELLDGMSDRGFESFVQRSEEIAGMSPSVDDDDDDDDSVSATLHGGSAGENQSDQEMEGSRRQNTEEEIGHGLDPGTRSLIEDHMMDAETFLDSMKELLLLQTGPPQVNPLPINPAPVQKRWDVDPSLQSPQRNHQLHDPPVSEGADTPLSDDNIKALIGAKYADTILTAKWGLRRKDILVLRFDVDEEMAKSTRRWATRENQFEYVTFSHLRSRLLFSDDICISFLSHM